MGILVTKKEDDKEDKTLIDYTGVHRPHTASATARSQLAESTQLIAHLAKKQRKERASNRELVCLNWYAFMGGGQPPRFFYTTCEQVECRGCGRDAG